MLIKNIVFDLDETLYNDQDVKAEADVQVLNFLAKNIDEIDVIKDYQLFKQSDRETVYEWFEAFLNNFSSGKADPNLVRSAEKIYWEVLSQIKPYPDALIFLKKVKDEYKLGILSDGSRNKQLKKMAALQLTNFFNPNFLVFSEDVGEKKPSQILFSNIIKKMEIDPAETLYIGDSVDQDIIGGNMAGFQTVLLRRNRSYHAQVNGETGRPNIEINTFFDLYSKI